MIDWLKDLFGLPPEFGGVMVTGGTMANFTALAAARQWCLRQAGVDVAEDGLAGAAPVHDPEQRLRAQLDRQGGGDARDRPPQRQDVRRLIERPPRPGRAGAGAGRARRRPAIVVANAGEVNAGEFDPIEAMAELAEQHGAWLHVDGTFGLFARISPRLAPPGRRSRAGGLGDRRRPQVAQRALRLPASASSVTIACSPRCSRWRAPISRTIPTRPECSGSAVRRCRVALALCRCSPPWPPTGGTATARSSSTASALAARAGGQVEEAEDFELLVAPGCASSRSATGRRAWRRPQLDDLNTRLGEAVLRDGRIYMGTTVSGGHVAFKPAFVNWRTTSREIALDPARCSVSWVERYLRRTRLGPMSDVREALPPWSTCSLGRR